MNTDAGEQLAKAAMLIVAIAAFNNFRRGGASGLLEWTGAKFFNAAAPKPANLDESTGTAGGTAVDKFLSSGDEADLVNVGSTRMSKRFAAKWIPLVAAAKKDGIILEGGAYRSNAQQIALRKAHCGTSHYDIYDKPSSQCSPPTARPGHSNHETGDAIDVTSGGATIRHGSKEFAWLAKNAGRFGVFNLPSESWHWSIDGN